ncbi:uncharacterized protein PAC_19380 [Phialocephala subalpina]|uniref:C2H2-type domain-containing protein n=1 Tax=Phialocephala subalpina TaxID=576137 RepID=A0A1L7XWV7_9HELO|nr:uncharacterized protein PAC_19380 [Phialocephala subalpina]
MPFYCTHCERAFNNWQGFNSHNEAKHNWECDYCYTTFPFESQKEHHEAMYHAFHCEECDRNFATEKDQAQHDAAKHHFECKFCDRVFRSEGARDQHQGSPAHNLKCTKCEKRFATEAGRNSHFIADHACDQCSLSFNTKKDVDLHRISAHRVPCEYCVKTFPSTETLQAHTNTMHSLKCQKCPRVFRLQENLSKHIEDEHTYKCSRCDITFDSLIAKSSHFYSTHCFKCENCQMSFETLVEKNRHYQSTHVTTCSRCHAEFTSQELLRVHFARAHVFPCEKCGLKCDSSAELSEHFAETHIFKCTACHEKFSTVEGRERHHRFHHEIECPNCSEKLETPLALLEHLRTHVHRCVDCDSGFDSQAKLEKHKEEWHTNVKSKLKCSGCAETFESPVLLLEHSKSAHRIQCEKCNGTFSDEETLSSRELAHHTTILKCPMCNIEAENNNGLTDHVAQAHPKAALLDSHLVIIKCEECAALFRTSEDLAEHIKLHRLATSGQDVPSKYKCINCEKDFGSQMDLATHILHAHFLRCKQCTGLRFASLQELSEHTAKMHMPVPVLSSSTQTDPVPDPVRTAELGLESYNTSTDTSSEDSFHDAPLPQTYALPQTEINELATQTTEHRCDACVAMFDNEEELDQHLENSPFHGPPALHCDECQIGPFRDQLELLKHIESKPHETKWVLSII